MAARFGQTIAMIVSFPETKFSRLETCAFPANPQPAFRPNSFGPIPRSRSATGGGRKIRFRLNAIRAQPVQEWQFNTISQ
jgi:hypothetical protein